MLFAEKLSEIKLFYSEIKNEEECHNEEHYIEQNKENLCAQKPVKNVESGENNGDGGYGESAVGLVAAFFNLLAFGFKNIEKCEADNGAKDEKAYKNNADNGVHAHAVAKVSGESAEAYHIAEGVQLDAEALFILAAVFLCAGDHAVKTVAKTGKEQAEYCAEEMPLA